MKLLVVVADKTELAPMKRLLAQAGVQAAIWMVHGEGFESKPSMKQIRELKPVLDGYLKQYQFTHIFAAGETASRLVLDTSAVNINKLRGRSFEYNFGTKEKASKAKNGKTQEQD